MILSPFERMIAKRYLLPGKGEAFIALVAGISVGVVMLSVAMLVVVMSVMNGFRAELLDKIVGLNGHAIVQAYGGRLDNWEEMLTEVRQTPGVVEASPLIEQPLLVTFNGRVEGIFVRGQTQDDLAGLADRVLLGNISELRPDAGSVAIGSRLAQNIGARVGDTITIINPQGRATPFGTSMRQVGYRVAAIFEVGIYDYDEKFVMMPMADAQTLLLMGDSVGMIEVKVTDPDKVGEILAPVQEKVAGRAVVADWKTMNATLFEALLKAVGIDSSPVLLNASNAYQMPSVPTLGIFNHVMTWIPELRLFVDSSAISVDFGELPTVLSDKPAPIVKKARIARTPPQRPREQSIALQVGFSVSGNALVTMDDVALGWTGSTRREVFRDADLIELGSAAQSMLLASTLRGDAWLEVREDPQAARRSALRLDGEVQGLLQGPRLRLLSAIGSGIATLAQDYAPHRRRSAPWVCVPARIREQADYQLAESMRIAQLPSRVSIDGKGFRYRASYHLHGSKLQVRRSLSIDVESNVCEPERFETLQGLFDDVRRDLAASAQLRSAWREPVSR